MNQNRFFLIAAFLGSILSASAQLTIPSDGSDGALNITTDTVIDLSQAVTGTWDQNNTANSGKGVYDPEKWAVIFKYSSVNVLAGRTVRFTNHPSRAPVVWLVQGNVEIDGTLNLKGTTGVPDTVGSLSLSEAGPGGFRGAARGPTGFGDGLGPAGSIGSGAYATTYGNPQIIPLIGGSGGGNVNASASGGGGGGAILIACPNILSVDGLINADGSDMNNISFLSHGGAGGAVRLIASSVVGSGTVRAIGNEAGALQNGRIRIETISAFAPTLLTFPETIGVPPANPPIIWPAANAPKARVVSVGSVAAPLDPTSPLIAAADVAIQSNDPVNILIETRDFPIEGVVRLSVIPKFSGRSTHSATRISGDINLATWRVTTTLPQGFVVLQARATQP